MKKAIFLVAALCLPAAPSVADIRSSEIWDEFLGSLVELSNQGDVIITVEVGEETTESYGLLLSDVSFIVEEYGEVTTVKMDWIKLLDTIDGGVEITINPISNMIIESPVFGGEGNGLTVDFIQSGFLSLVTGDIDNYTVDTTMDKMKVFVPIQSNDPDETGVFTAVLQNMTSQIDVSTDVSNLFSDVALAIETISMKLDFEGTKPTFDLDGSWDSPEEPRPEVFAMTSEIRDFRLSGQEEETGLDHEINSFDELPAMRFLAAIASADLDLSYTGYNYSGEPNSGTLVASSGEMRAELTADTQNISAEAVVKSLVANADLDTVEVTDVFDVSLAEMGYRLNVAIDAENGRASGTYRENIDALLLGDSFWNLFDPDITIPRDPISSVMDVAGELLFDPEKMDVENIENANRDVFKTARLTLNQYLIQGGGVRIEATGEAEMDVEGIDLDFDTPKANATLHIDMQGGFDMIGKLLELGIIPANIAFGARTVIGMVGIRQAEGDHFVSDITIDETGDLTVNGKPFEIPD